MLPSEQQQPQNYRQQLGLKKILYKYQNENQQLRSQIRALNERLQWILNKPKTPEQKAKLNPIQEYQGQILKEEMGKLYKEISYQAEEMKINRDGVDERHEQKCREIEDKIVKEEKEIKELKAKIQKYEKIDEGININLMTNKNAQLSFSTQLQQQPPQQQLSPPNSPLKQPNNQSPSKSPANTLSSPQNPISLTPPITKLPPTTFDPTLLLHSNNKTLRNSTIRVQNYLQKLSLILQQTQKYRKTIKELQHVRDQNEKSLIKKHTYQVDVKGYNRALENTVTGNIMAVQQEVRPQRKGVVGMENTKENYQLIRAEIEKLKKEKSTTLETIRNENIVLQNKVAQLQSQLQSIGKTIQMPPLPYQKRPIKLPLDLSLSTKLQSPLIQKKSLKPLQFPITEFQRNNDKNYIPKKPRKVEWQSTKNNASGIQWNDQQCRSAILGVNLWFDVGLVGVEFIHELGSSGQQLQVMGGKKIVPIQYRLGNGDCLQNVVLYIAQGLIHGVEFVSKNGRLDKFGNISRARKFDFGIKKPQKPVVSFGQYRINNTLSQITKLGFQII